MSTCHSSHIVRHVDNIAFQDAEFARSDAPRSRQPSVTRSS